MAKDGPIILVDDDLDDKEIFEEALRDLQIANRLIHFTHGDEAIDYLKETTDQPFLIFCDVNLPARSGLEFKKQIDEYPQLRVKSIPFVFYSTSVDQKSVNEAYSKMTVQGFFQKKSTYQAIKEDLVLICDYWEKCKHPNAR